jgi:hypothetical protein
MQYHAENQQSISQNNIAVKVIRQFCSNRNANKQRAN